MRTVTTPAEPLQTPSQVQHFADALACGDCTEEEKWDLDARREAVTIDLHRGSPAAATVQPARPDCAVPSAPERMAISIGRLLRNRYVVLGLVGRGGMGDVFKAADGLGALHAETQGHVAIKVLRERSDRRPDMMAKLQREFECARRLSHPSVVKVYEFNRNDPIAFYTMELLEGEHTGELLMREGRRPLRRDYAWGIIRAVGAALAHAHSRNVIHGDISPKNVMITRAGEVRVLDFGSSTLLSGAQSASEIPQRIPVAATPAYASCELLDGRQPEARDDLYSLACLSYELLCGEHPFQGRQATDARDRGMQVRRPSNLSASQWRTLRRGLSFSREQRSMSVRQWLRGLGLEPDPDRLPAFRAAATVSTRPPRIPGAMAATLGIAALTFMVAAWHGLQRPSDPGPLVSRTAPALDASAESLDRRDAAPALPDGAATSPPLVAAIASEAAAAAMPMPFLMPPPAAPTAQPPTLRRPAEAARGKPRHPPALHRLAATVPASRWPAIRFATNRYTVQSKAHFVELPVRRTAATADTAGFVWWTADASAKAGKDFVRQSPTRYVFPKGHQVASVFVKLLTPAQRAGHSDFRVCLGKSRSPAALTDVTCSAVILPANSSDDT